MRILGEKGRQMMYFVGQGLKKSQVESSTFKIKKKKKKKKCRLSRARKLKLGFRCDLSFSSFSILNLFYYYLDFSFLSHFFSTGIFCFNLKSIVFSLLCDSAGSHFPRFCFHGSSSVFASFLSPKDRNNSSPSPPLVNSPDSTLILHLNHFVYNELALVNLW